MFSHEDALFLGLRAAFRPRGGAGGERRGGGACGAGVVSPACPPDSSRHAEDVTGEKTPFRLERDGETPRDERDKKRARRKSVLSPGRTGRSPGNGPGRATCRNADAPQCGAGEVPAGPALRQASLFSVGVEKEQ